MGLAGQPQTPTNESQAWVRSALTQKIRAPASTAAGTSVTGPVQPWRTTGRHLPSGAPSRPTNGASKAPRAVETRAPSSVNSPSAPAKA